MEFIFYAIVLVVSAATLQALPIDKETKFVKPVEEIIVKEPVYLIEFTAPELEKHLQKREISSYDDNDDSSSIEEGVEETRRRYVPYFRFRKIYSTRYGQPLYPASNYADSYDRFPTVA